MDTGMRVALHRQVSSGSLKESGELRRQSSLESPRTGRAATRFLFGRQSSMDPNRRRGRSQSPVGLAEDLTVPDNLDATMQLLFLACHGDAAGVEALLRGGVDVNSINLDGRTALHIASCEGHPDVVRVLLTWKANIDARDRWGSTVSDQCSQFRFYRTLYDIVLAEIFNFFHEFGKILFKFDQILLKIRKISDRNFINFGISAIHDRNHQTETLNPVSDSSKTRLDQHQDFRYIFWFRNSDSDLIRFFLESQAVADAKCYGHTEVYNLLKARGAKIPVSFCMNKLKILSFALNSFGSSVSKNLRFIWWSLFLFLFRETGGHR